MFSMELKILIIVSHFSGLFHKLYVPRLSVEAYNQISFIILTDSSRATIGAGTEMLFLSLISCSISVVNLEQMIYLKENSRDPSENVLK